MSEPVSSTLDLPVLESSRLRIRLGLPAEAARVVDYYVRNKHHLRPYIPYRKKEFYTVDFWASQLQDNIDDFRDGKSLRMFMFSLDDVETVIGTVNFSNVVRGAAHFCNLGYDLDEQSQGKGLMREALETAIPYVFENLNMHRIMANYMPTNERSGKLLRRLGFAVEGYARDYLLINGKWRDHVLTAMVNEDWEE